MWRRLLARGRHDLHVERDAPSSRRLQFQEKLIVLPTAGADDIQPARCSETSHKLPIPQHAIWVAMNTIQAVRADSESDLQSSFGMSTVSHKSALSRPSCSSYCSSCGLPHVVDDSSFLGNREISNVRSSETAEEALCSKEFDSYPFFARDVLTERQGVTRRAEAKARPAAGGTTAKTPPKPSSPVAFGTALSRLRSLHSANQHNLDNMLLELHMLPAAGPTFNSILSFAMLARCLAKGSSTCF